jgi:hypothetical protein
MYSGLARPKRAAEPAQATNPESCGKPYSFPPGARPSAVMYESVATPYTMQITMTRTIPFPRSANAARAQRKKALLLPMPMLEAERLALQVHIALDAMGRTKGNVHAAQTLCQVMILTGLLAEAGYGQATFEQMRDAEKVIAAAFDQGRDRDVWTLDEDGFEQFATIVSTYDYQLRRAPLAAVADAGDRLDRFRAGESFGQVARRRA